MRQKYLTWYQVKNLKSTNGIKTTWPWEDEPRQINDSKIGKQLHLTKGVHMSVAHEKLTVKHVVDGMIWTTEEELEIWIANLH